MFKRFGAFLLLTFGATLLILVIFGTLQKFNISAGNLTDWVFGIASFWWLLMITTIPWNIYFRAKEVVYEAEQTIEKGSDVNPERLKYVHRIAQWSLIIAIGLHAVSTIVLYVFAMKGISSVGYVSSGAALLLTILRPSVRLYEYIAAKLRSIEGEFRYPRDDVYVLEAKVRKLQENLEAIQSMLSFKNEDSWANNVNSNLEDLSKSHHNLAVIVDQNLIDAEKEHQDIRRTLQEQIQKIIDDGKFIESLREIIRFVKRA